ncbi:MAG: FAD-dependent monooxygenase, partial [Acidimicrobiia bacterium]|nr:FAD-dependent monooxygenase [Acidimicrobiia bacterium]
MGLDVPTGGYEMIFGKRAFFGYAVAPDGEVWWFANIPRSDEPAPGEVEGIDEQKWIAHLMDLFAEDAGPATRLIDATPTIGNASAVHSIPHLPTWHTDRMVVIGDAAHAPSPS